LHGIDDRFRAAILLYHARNKAQAQSAFERAAVDALANGLVALAADAFIKAGITAIERGKNAEAVAILGKARRLSNSPHLTLAERTTITKWFVTPVVGER
jgi:hypothetical protein